MNYRPTLAGLLLGFESPSPTPCTPDPLARRVLETIDIESDDNIEGSKQLVYAGASEWEIIEQIDLISDTLLMTHVFGLGIDDEIAYTIENASPDPLHRWTHRDDQNTLTSVTDESGTVLERYEYGDYGLPTILTPAGAVLTESAGTVKAFHLYTGRPFIAHVQIMDFRYRFHDPALGRFMQRDPLWHTDSMNLYVYVAASPHVYVDPYGEGMWSDLRDGFSTVINVIDGSYFDEVNDQQNNITRINMTNYRKARDRGDDCFAISILLQNMDDMRKIGDAATGVANQTVELLEAIKDTLAESLVPGFGGAGHLKKVTTHLRPRIGGSGKPLRNIFRFFPSPKKAKEGKLRNHMKPKPAKKGQPQVTRQTRNKSGEGNTRDRHAPGQNSHTHDRHHNNNDYVNNHWGSPHG